MSRTPKFSFERDMERDIVHMTVVDEHGLSSTHELDGMRFDLNAPAALPDEYAEHAEIYQRAVSDFVRRATMNIASVCTSDTRRSNSAQG